MIKVFGHMSPDTDTTGCAVLWAWYLNAHTTNEATPYVLGTLNKETAFVLNRWGVEEPALLESISEDDKIVIVDTNNPQELFANINDASIVQIIDHHKLVGGLTSKEPIDITIRPLASTATVIHDLIGEHVATLPDEMAGIMLSCILSDTLAFRSPTTTPHDKGVAEQLAKKLGLDINSYADELFTAKSDVSDFTDTGLLHIDSKKYPVGDKNFRISVVETTNPSEILAREEGIVNAIKDLVAEENDIDDILFFVIDILKEEATVFTYNQLTKDLVSASFGVSATKNTETLPGVVSRKKQILPVLKF
ncbi:MAG TPA: manganese-dependent inorganic pyrophosphatase [Candidatus Paceibacterota bacterium]|jgi:manganese-dependent inorganic pyrophosphatase|nr:manganese-dependent inorganic pyrophosphatase [Candidatus Paceibacterota bacterium]